MRTEETRSAIEEKRADSEFRDGVRNLWGEGEDRMWGEERVGG